MKARVDSIKDMDNDLLKEIKASDKFLVTRVFYKETHHNLRATYPMPTIDLKLHPESVRVVFKKENIIDTISLKNPTITRYISGELNYEEYKKEESLYEKKTERDAMLGGVVFMIVILTTFGSCVACS